MNEPQTVSPHNLEKHTWKSRPQASVTDRALKAHFSVSEEQLRLALEAGRMGTLDFDLIKGQIFLDQRGLEILGFTPDTSLTFEHLSELVHPDDLDRTITAFYEAAAVTASGRYDIEQRVIQNDGSLCWVRVKGQFQFEGEGDQRRAIRFVGIVEDITTRKKAEQELQESRVWFQAAIESSFIPVAIFSTVRNEQGKIVDFQYEFVNPAAQEANQMTQEQLKDRTMLEVFPGHRESGFFEGCCQVVETGKPLEMEAYHYQGVTPNPNLDGGYFNMIVTRFGETIVVMWRDVTERKHADEQLHRANRHLKFLSEAAAGLLASDDPLIFLEPLYRRLNELLEVELCFHFANENDDHLRLAAFLGLPEETAAEVSTLAFGQAVCGVVAAQRHSMMVENVQNRSDEMTHFIRQLGITAYVCFPLIARDRLIGTLSFGSRRRLRFQEEELTLIGSVCDMVAIALERKQAEAEAARLKEQLEERVEERTRQVRQLVSRLTMAEQEERRRISHILHDELQQSLYSQLFKLDILNFNLATQGASDLADQCSKIIQEINEAIDLTRSLVVDLNSPMLKAEAPAEALAWLIGRIEERYPLKVQLSVQDQAQISNKDTQVLLLQMVRELLFNIVKHAGTDQAQVKLGQNDGVVLIRIEDDGVGFNFEEMQGRPGKQGGFGLTNMEERLALIGGQLEIDSAPGQGTRVTLKAPVR